MKTIYWIIIVDIMLFIIMIKMIFGSMNVFKKAILDRVFSGFDVFEVLDVFEKWDKEHDIKHKMNLLYAAMICILGGSLLLYTQL
jgi:hypothetical protein